MEMIKRAEEGLFHWSFTLLGNRCASCGVILLPGLFLGASDLAGPGFGF